MTEVVTGSAKCTVWVANDKYEPLHEGRAIEYIITIRDGRPQSYQRTVYEDGDVIAAYADQDVSGVPDYVRREVEKHMTPRGMWPE